MYQFYCDCGTSNIRGYLIKDKKVFGKKHLGIGSKDVSISNDKRILVEGLKSVYDDLISRLGISDNEVSDLYASGMITSPFGLIEVPHAVLPLDKKKIRESIYTYSEDTLFHRQINLIRGAKTADGRLTLDSIDQINNLRGEEIEVLGICNHIPREWKSSQYIILLPGSHTHAVLMENETLIDIFSTFSGEIFHALTNATILSGSTEAKDETDRAIDKKVIQLGCNFVKKYGFARAVYIVHAMKIFDVSDNLIRRDCLSSIVVSSVIESLLLNMKNKWTGVKNVAVYANNNILETYLEVIKQFDPDMNVLSLLIEDSETTCSVEGFIRLINS